MQLIKLSLVLFSFYTTLSFAYECKTSEINFKVAANKKDAFLQFSKPSRQLLLENLLFEITSQESKTKLETKKVVWLFDYLENTEQNTDNRSLIKLLRITSEIDSPKVKKLDKNEICEIINKVNTVQTN